MLRLILPALALVADVARASLVLPNDGPYRGARFDQKLFVFAPELAAEMPSVAGFTAALRRSYEASFGWSLDEEEDLMIASTNQQFDNAYATVAPNLKTFWWTAGAGATDGLAVPSWAFLIASHETAHLYQLNAKGPVNRRLKRVFGNADQIHTFGWPLTIHPNQFLPTSLLEGNAVLNESRLNLGGRLYSGELRATVLSLIAAGRVDAARLINDEFKFPFGEAAYDLGAYFMAHLNQKYGIERTNGVFRVHGDHWLNPLLLDRTFRAHFGTSFYEETREFIRDLEPRAAAQRRTSASPLAEGVRVSALNHDDARVWWLANPGYRTPDLYVFDKRTGALTKRTIDLPHGKVFWREGRPFAAASFQPDLRHRRFGLYGEHGAAFDEAAGEIVTDERAGHRASLDAARSFTVGHVLKDGAPFALANSNPILDSVGNVYYLRQVGSDRVLYRNRDLVARLPGYYAKLTEVDEAGRVHFIGATEYGSTLYRVDGGEIFRVLDSDVVVDARVLDDGRVLVNEVSADGYRVLVAPQNPRPERPVTYAYAFAPETLTSAPAEGVDFEHAAPYGGLRESRFSEFNVSFGFATGPGGLAALGAKFRDPLEYHGLALDLGLSVAGPRRAQLEYAFERYLTQPFARFTHFRDALGAEDEVNLGFNLPVLRRERWDARLRAAGLFTTGDRRERGAFARAELKRAVPSAIGLYPWRSLRSSVSHRLTSAERSASFDVSFDRGFTYEYYLGASGQLATSDGGHLRVGYVYFTPGTQITVPRLGGPTYLSRSIARVRVEARKVITLPRYDARLPLGLDRFAPIATAQTLAARGAAPIHEVGLGTDLNGLLIHRIAFTTRVLAGITDVGGPAAETFVRIDLQSPVGF